MSSLQRSLEKLEHYLRKNKALKQLITELLEEEFRSLLLKLLIMEELTRDIRVAEKEIMAMD